jgi:Tfp pilus assembly protein PilV
MNMPREFTMSTRKGITLLEVLIAAGVLVVGLTSVLAMIPAAGSLFGEASMSDRAAALASNAAADLRFRGVFKASDFNGTVKTSVFGATAVTGAAAFSGGAFKRGALPNPDPMADENAYGRAGYAAVVSPIADATSYVAGDSARVTVVVFKTRTPEREEISLANVSPGVYKLTGGSEYQQEDRRKRLLQPCSWVAVQKDARVRWLHIGSSWTASKLNAGNLVLGDSYVSFTVAEEADEAIVDTVSAFSGILKVEDHIVELD